MTTKAKSRALETREVRRPAMDRRWSPAIAERVLDIVAKTGSPKTAARHRRLGCDDPRPSQA